MLWIVVGITSDLCWRGKICPRDHGLKRWEALAVMGKAAHLLGLDASAVDIQMCLPLLGATLTATNQEARALHVEKSALDGMVQGLERQLASTLEISQRTDS
jgi:hypothetical protein